MKQIAMKISIELLLIYLVFISKINNSNSKSRSLSRQKRYVVFPEGSVLTVGLCWTVNLADIPTTIFTEVIIFGINYDLPNNTALLFKGLESKETSRRRHRRELYNKVEIILNAMGLNGNECVYKALCEVVQILNKKEYTMMEEVLKRLFSFPLEKMHYLEPDEHLKYHWAHSKGHENENCNLIFSNCHISLIEMILGYNKYKIP